MPADPSTRGELDATLHQAFADMERRLQAGEPWDADAFLSDHPDFISDPERAVDLILHEYFLRRRLGQELDPHEWFRRFPRWEELLHRRLQCLQTVGGSASLDHDAPTEEHTPARAAAVDEAIPELGRHEVYEEIGRGGMGVVYRAQDLILHRPVALKMIVPRQGLLETPDAVQRFYREARAAARLRHPNIIPIHGMGLHEGRHCFTMPLLIGALSGRTAHCRGDARMAAALVEKIARAVQYAHEQGVIHRDLKPANILLDEQGEPLVADFGLAKVVDADADASAPGVRVGTPSYMSPEQAAGHTWEVSARSDVWALGVILYELLTGVRPFTEATPEGIYKQVMTGQPTAPRSHRAALPAELEGAVLKCLQKDPARRYATAGELADDLARWLRGEPARRKVARWSRWTRPLRGRRGLLVACAVVLVLLGAAAVLSWSLLNFTDPDRILHDNQRRLANGEAVTLVGRSGPPAWSRWALGGGLPETPVEKDGAYTFNTFNPAMQELMRDAPRAYRLTADVRHDDGRSINSEVGLYFIYTYAAAANGDLRCFGCLTFNDFSATGRVDAPQMSLARLMLHLTRGENDKDHPVSLREKKFLPANTASPGVHPWRRLAVEVRPNAVRAWWADNPVFPLQPLEPPPGDRVSPPEVQAAELQNNLGAIHDDVVNGQVQDLCPGFNPRFGPDQPLGLIVRGGSASFRNVVVEPLP